MLFLRKLFKLPSPVDLGRSKHNALPLKEFSPECKDYCWEDWNDEVKQLHPVKYWISETFGDFIRYKIWLPIWRPIENARYWFVSHFVPSRRYHFLDLRQPCKSGEISNFDCYRWGWQDVPEKMLYAMFNLLGEYLKKEEPADLIKWYSIEDINADPCLKSQYEALNEAKAIYHWWTVERKLELEKDSKLLHSWSEAKKSMDPNTKELWDKLQESGKVQEEKIDEMLIRLLKIRRNLWT